MRIYLIRHGETRGNKEGYFRGRSDFPLNENGIVQAKSLAVALKNSGIQKIFSSPLSRSLETARILSEETDAEVIVEEGFNNINLGPWEGRKKDEIKKEYPREFEMWITRPEELRIEGAETILEVMERSVKTLEKLRKELPQQGIETIAIVTHRAVLKPLIAGILEIKIPFFWKIHVDTASYSILEYNSKRGYTLKVLNQTSHLKKFVVEEY
ncbi:MAG: histidine phosphatase family protein [Candidatus Aminicenantes bacterium]|nr:histidine phosphatase family protein [Candidatus Aminicenantes bacterium]